MKEYRINGKVVQFDSTKSYMDFSFMGGPAGRRPVTTSIDLEKLLAAIQDGQVPVDSSLREWMTYLTHWKLNAPIKRAKREWRRAGMTVLTTDCLFEEDGGEKIIDALENTGVFASYFLNQVYGNPSDN